MNDVCAELKDLHSPDAFDLSKYAPKNKHVFSVLIQLMVGPKGGEGEESFEVIVCTPLWLSSKLEKEQVILGIHHVFVLEYDHIKIKNALYEYVKNCRGSSWAEVAQKVARIGRWEFEDYVDV